ncbi:2-acylglycerol O-acyltransferase 1 [Clonorchis sinensis]|uniref:Acyltransferase n=1 Tax=Clonorchis sinensis TaxID=79923 RepID=H2KSU3_CLOSI|nr:2-acylglycerol O-acyltransferase 1 [Clonorchis sinensis]
MLIFTSVTYQGIDDMTEAVDCNQSSFTSDLGIIIKPRPRRPKSYFVRFVEFYSVCQWVTGFLFFGISCYAIFMYLIYSMLKHLVLLVWLSVSEPHEDWFVYTITSWDKMEAIYTSISVALVGLYLYYWQHDLRAEERGAHPRTWLRNLWLWKRLADYFPIQLVLSDELLKSEYAESAVDCKSDNKLNGFGGLSTKRNYLVGYHPHGVFSTGAFVNFMTEATGFSLAFPGLTPWLAVLKAHFKSPFYRDYLMALGIIAATKRGLRYLLDAEECGKTGNFVVVVVGGAPEALEAKPGQYRLVIRQRYGFFKLAIQTGAYLVPCVSFGEAGMYKQVRNEPGTILRRLQDWITQLSTFAPPVFYARGPFPYRTPVNTVVGAPIPCERIAEPSQEEVQHIKQIYLERLRNLFARYKPIFDPEAHDIEFV